MKILRLLNKINFSIIFLLFCNFVSLAEEEPVDIWNIDKKKTEKISTNENSNNDQDTESTSTSEVDIYSLQSTKELDSIELDKNIDTKEVKIFGLFDPEDYGLDINMWSNSDGDQLK